MADFLANLAGRALGQRPVVRPHLAPLFAPGPSLGADTAWEIEFDSEVEPASPPDTTVPIPSRPSRDAARVQDAVTIAVPTPTTAMQSDRHGGAKGDSSAPGETATGLETTTAALAPVSVTAPMLAPVSATPASPIIAPPNPKGHNTPSRAPASRRATVRPADKDTSPLRFDPLQPQSRRDGIAADGAGLSAAPEIRVTIGRVDVRLVSTPPAAPPRRAPTAPRLALTDYLDTRQEAGR
jgi:hypothetical protein